jgi:hypothetical protein
MIAEIINTLEQLILEGYKYPNNNIAELEDKSFLGYLSIHARIYTLISWLATINEIFTDYMDLDHTKILHEIENNTEITFEYSSYNKIRWMLNHTMNDEITNIDITNRMTKHAAIIDCTKIIPYLDHVGLNYNMEKINLPFGGNGQIIYKTTLTGLLTTDLNTVIQFRQLLINIRGISLKPVKHILPHHPYLNIGDIITVIKKIQKNKNSTNGSLSLIYYYKLATIIDWYRGLFNNRLNNNLVDNKLFKIIGERYDHLNVTEKRIESELLYQIMQPEVSASKWWIIARLDCCKILLKIHDNFRINEMLNTLNIDIRTLFNMISSNPFHYRKLLKSCIKPSYLNRMKYLITQGPISLLPILSEPLYPNKSEPLYPDITEPLYPDLSVPLYPDLSVPLYPVLSIPQDSDIIELSNRLPSKIFIQPFTNSKKTIILDNFYGEATVTGCLVPCQQVQEGFNITNLEGHIINSNSEFDNGYHYQIYDNQVYMTILGITKAVTLYQKRNESKLKLWVSEYFTGYEKIDSTFIHIDESAIPGGVYLIKLGTVYDTRETFSINQIIPNNLMVYKYGFSINRVQRMKQHEKEYGRKKGVILQQIIHTPIKHKKNMIIAEKELGVEFSKMGCNLPHIKYQELLVMSKTQENIAKKLFVNIARTYI